MKFLVVGCGSMGKRRMRCLKANGQQDIIAFDTREDRREEVKKLYGGNDTDRKRNSTKFLAGDATVATERHALVEAEYAAALARLDLERSADHVQNLRSIAWAWGSECNRGYEPVEDRMARRDQALPASMMAERAGIKLTRDVD